MEVLSYTLAAVIIKIAVSLGSTLMLEYEPQLWISNALALLIAVPIPALMARRCHDQNRTGHWVWLAVFSFAVWLLGSVVSLVWGYETRIEVDSITWPFDMLAALCSLVALVVLFLPGTKGLNDFGPDPRTRN
jgi:uncharacterized membrane protein YhaH (DUF805 family)